MHCVWAERSIVSSPQMYPFIRIICPCNTYRLEPHFSIEKLGYIGGIHFLPFVTKHKIVDTGKNRLESVLKCTHNQCFEQKYGKINVFS